MCDYTYTRTIYEKNTGSHIKLHICFYTYIQYIYECLIYTRDLSPKEYNFPHTQPAACVYGKRCCCAHTHTQQRGKINTNSEFILKRECFNKGWSTSEVCACAVAAAAASHTPCVYRRRRRRRRRIMYIYIKWRQCNFERSNVLHRICEERKRRCCIFRLF